MAVTYDHNDRPDTGLGGSTRAREEDKDLFWKPEVFVPGAGVQFDYVALTESGDMISDPNNVPWGSAIEKGLKVTVSGGYDGTVTVSGVGGNVVFTIQGGLITGVA